MNRVPYLCCSPGADAPANQSQPTAEFAPRLCLLDFTESLCLLLHFVPGHLKTPDILSSLTPLQRILPMDKPRENDSLTSEKKKKDTVWVIWLYTWNSLELCQRWIFPTFDLTSKHTTHLSFAVNTTICSLKSFTMCVVLSKASPRGDLDD